MAGDERAVANTQQRPDQADRRKRPILVLLLAFFPMLIGVGFFAPGLIGVMAEEDEGRDDDGRRISRRLSRYGHQPMLLQRDFTEAFVPELLDLEHLFSRTDYMRDERGMNRFKLPSFPRDFGDVIVLDDVDQLIREIVFKDPVLMAQAGPPKWPPPSPDITPLGGPEPHSPGPRYDGYFGPQVSSTGPVVIPEPSTGMLLGMGLTMLGLLRRRRG